jgi:NADH-quinone oxidoreductase subunit L
MLLTLPLVPALPFLGFLVLALFGSRLSRPAIAAVGVGSVGFSALVTILIALGFFSSPPAGGAYSQTLWTWIQAGSLQVGFTLYLDSLSLVMAFVVTFVGFLIHLYAVDYMSDDPDLARFFAYMNLFAGMMLVLVLAKSLLLLLLGWEGVGLCSFLLIGFWYRDPANGRAARKAFVVTRVGDTALLIGLFYIFANLGTLDIQEAMRLAAQNWKVGSVVATTAALLLLGGALGKSAQLPLQVWLPDAMAGPTPVSALIHAATMVTAGVYLIARTNALFALSPLAMSLVATIGAVGLLYSGLAALAQTDIKRALAYSTMSQIGYMFLALGVGAYSAAIFHLFTHAFFKALLFMAAGAVILAMHHEQNMFRMGGLRRVLPFTYWVFLAGAASLAALPIVTAGFYSKDLILAKTYGSDFGGPLLWVAGVVGALITALYSFRIVFLTFHGSARSSSRAPHLTTGGHAPGDHVGGYSPSLAAKIPLAVLAVLAIGAGFVEVPRWLGNVTLFTTFLGGVLPSPPTGQIDPGAEVFLTVLPAVLSLGGILIAYLLYARSRRYSGAVDHTGVPYTPFGQPLEGFWRIGWGIDWLYQQVFVRAYSWLAESLRSDYVDSLFTGIAELVGALNTLLARTQNGVLRWYSGGIALGAVIALAIGVFG